MFYIGPYKTLKNTFWKEVFQAWSDMISLNSVENSTNFVSCSIWKNNNIKIGNRNVLYKKWIQKGIWTINDLLETNGNVMSFRNFQDTFNITCNFLEYHGIVSAIKKIGRTYNINFNNIEK